MDGLPTTRYLKSDDVHIAYQVFGEGSLELLFVPGFVSNIEAIWESPDHRAFFRRLALFCRVILFDKRGTGMSDRGSQIFTLEQRMHDVQAILDAVGCEQAALFGVSEGGPMSLRRDVPCAHVGPCAVRLLRQALLGAGLSVWVEGRTMGARV